MSAQVPGLWLTVTAKTAPRTVAWCLTYAAKRIRGLATLSAWMTCLVHCHLQSFLNALYGLANAKQPMLVFVISLVSKYWNLYERDKHGDNWLLRHYSDRDTRSEGCSYIYGARRVI